MSKPAVFLDRDGTLLEEAGYLDRLERLVFFPYSVDAVRLLNRAGFAFYYCPHHPEAVVEAYRRSCDCRKPQSGLFTRAAAELDLALDRSFVVGDRWHDLEAGQRVGARGILVRTGYGKTEESSPGGHAAPSAIVDNMIEAVSWILSAS